VKARGWEIVDRIRGGETLVFDGGYGTMLFAAGLANGACPELWNDTHGDVVRGIHAGYFGAGSQIVETNTFGGTRLKLNEYKIGDRTRELNEKGARLALAAAPPSGYVAGSGNRARGGRGRSLRGRDHDVPAGVHGGDPCVQGGGGPAGDGHHVLPVRGDARPGPDDVG
jgi:hypothetical protein